MKLIRLEDVPVSILLEFIRILNESQINDNQFELSINSNKEYTIMIRDSQI